MLGFLRSALTNLLNAISFWPTHSMSVAEEICCGVLKWVVQKLCGRSGRSITPQLSHPALYTVSG